MADELALVVERIVKHLADVLARASGQTVRALPTVGASAVDWQIPLTFSGAHDASMLVGLPSTAAHRITGIVIGPDETFGEADVADTLKSILTQATGAYGNQAAPGLSILVGTPVHQACTPPGTAWQHDLVMESDDPPRVIVWTTVSAGAGAGPSASLAPRTGAAASGGSAGGATPTAHRNLDVVLDLELPITVRFGETRLTLDGLSRLGAGSLIDLGRGPDDPVDLLVNGRLVARGEVVVVAGCYGVRVREVVSAADRLRSLEG